MFHSVTAKIQKLFWNTFPLKRKLETRLPLSVQLVLVKSTLVNLIPRFYDATEGTIKVDGIDVRQYDHDTLHKIVGYIPQKAVLFSGDIASNMDMGRKQ